MASVSFGLALLPTAVFRGLFSDWRTCVSDPCLILETNESEATFGSRQDGNFCLRATDVEKAGSGIEFLRRDSAVQGSSLGTSVCTSGDEVSDRITVMVARALSSRLKATQRLLGSPLAIGR